MFLYVYNITIKDLTTMDPKEFVKRSGFKKVGDGVFVWTTEYLEVVHCQPISMDIEPYLCEVQYTLPHMKVEIDIKACIKMLGLLKDW